VVIGAARVGVRHAFGQVDARPLLSGIRFVRPWSSVEEFSSREEQTLTPEALTKRYLEVLHDMRQSSNIVVMVPTEGGVPSSTRDRCGETCALGRSPDQRRRRASCTIPMPSSAVAAKSAPPGGVR
jgi:hypothetical protein